MTAIKRINFEKTCSILHSTYGTVPCWNPINYDKNILVYDVHQQLRNNCIKLKEMIIAISPDFTDDMITVDIVYHYPIDIEYTNNISEYERNQAKWRIITSGDHTSSNLNLHTYLNDDNSFYSYLKEQQLLI